MCWGQAERAPEMQAEKLKTKQNKTGNRGQSVFLNGGNDMFKGNFLWFSGNDFITQGFVVVQQFSNYLADL